MKASRDHNERIAQMSFARVYPLYVTKVTKKGRTKKELDTVIRWLTGLSDRKIQMHIARETTFAEFFKTGKLNPNAHLITGMICGYRIEEITNPLTKRVRYLDKLVDELARGKSLDKILRK